MRGHKNPSLQEYCKVLETSNQIILETRWEKEKKTSRGRHNYVTALYTLEGHDGSVSLDRLLDKNLYHALENL